MNGTTEIYAVLGPMTRSMSGVKVFSKAVIDSKPWTKDSHVIRKDWDEEAYQLKDHGGGRNLCFAIMWDNEVVKPHPPLIRGLELTKKALQAAGHKGISASLGISPREAHHRKSHRLGPTPTHGDLQKCGTPVVSPPVVAKRCARLTATVRK